MRLLGENTPPAISEQMGYVNLQTVSTLVLMEVIKMPGMMGKYNWKNTIRFGTCFCLLSNTIAIIIALRVFLLIKYTERAVSS